MANWKEVRKKLNFTDEEEEAIRIEKELILAMVTARGKKKISQRALSEKSRHSKDNNC